MPHRHKCDREQCAPINVNGPKTKCAKCKNVCFLKCFGMDSAEKIDNNETMKIKASDGSIVYAFVAHLAFVCCNDTLSSTEQKSAMKIQSTRATSKTRQQKTTEMNEATIAKELFDIKTALATIKNSTDANSNDLNEIKSMSRELNEKIKKNEVLNIVENSSTSQPCETTPSFSNVVRNQWKTQTAKRKIRQLNDEKITNNKVKMPTPKVGTRDIQIGRQITPRKVRDLKPKFDRAVWVSGLHRDTSVEEMSDIITENTDIKDKSLFECHKLVKKDADISKLTYVSFKISINSEYLDHLLDPDTWPNTISVREFLQKPTLGDYMPFLNTPRSQTAQRNKVQKTEQKNEQQPTKQKSATNKAPETVDLMDM